MSNSTLVHTSKPQIFLDYGELIFHYDFNKGTLFRAHQIALEEFARRGLKFNLTDLSTAHDLTIRDYLASRKSGKETSLYDLMTSMLKRLDSNIFSRPNVHPPFPDEEQGVGRYDMGCLENDLAEIYKAQDHDVRPMETTLESLPRIMEIAKVGIISNLPHNSLVFELANHGLYGFDPVTISYQVGFRKPHPAIYQEALRRANITAEEGTFFSHDQEEVEGAKAVGMQGYLVKNLGEVLAKLETSLR